MSKPAPDARQTRVPRHHRRARHSSVRPVQPASAAGSCAHGASRPRGNPGTQGSGPRRTTALSTALETPQDARRRFAFGYRACEPPKRNVADTLRGRPTHPDPVARSQLGSAWCRERSRIAAPSPSSRRVRYACADGLAAQDCARAIPGNRPADRAKARRAQAARSAVIVIRRFFAVGSRSGRRSIPSRRRISEEGLDPNFIGSRFDGRRLPRFASRAGGRRSASGLHVPWRVGRYQ